MDAIARAAAVYLVLLLVFRLSGQRSLAQITTFDFILLLIVGEATQQALLGEDYSLTNAALVILTLVVLDVLMTLVKERSPAVDRLIDGLPLVILADGKLLHERMKQVRIDESDILSAARERHGLERLDQIKYAVLERSGGVSIVPK